MRIEPRKSNKKNMIIAIVTLLAISGVCLYLYVTNPFSLLNDKSSGGSNSTNTSSKDTPDESTPQSNRSTTNEQTKDGNKTPIQYEGERVDDNPIINNEQFRIPED